MRRLLPLLAVGFLLVGVGATPSYALSETASTKLRALSQADLKALIADIDAQGLNTSGSANVKKGVGRMQLAAGRFGTLSAISTLGVVATGSVVVWKIADGLGLGGFVYRKITGETYGLTPPAGTIEWEYVTSGSAYNWSFSTNPRWALRSSVHTYTYCWSGGASADYTAPAWNNLANSLSGTAFLTNGAGGGACQPSNATYLKLRTAAQMEASVQLEPSDAAEFASPPGGATTRTAGTADPTTPTDPELEAALDAIDPNPGTPGTAVEEDTAIAILETLDPDWDLGVLLQPLPNETYTQYITRLQEAGWVGDATSTELATETPGYGPEAVVRVIATPVGGTSTVYDPLGWPSPAPEIAIDADITIRYNPDTAPEAPTTATPTPITGAPTTIPSTPALDFSPITDLDPGCKFPYGLVCYAIDFTEQFDVAADAPVFDFAVEADVAVGEFDLGDYTVDLAVMDGYMALWRAIWSVVIVVGAAYWLAARVLGFKAAGDPGAAMDDAL